MPVHIYQEFLFLLFSSNAPNVFFRIFLDLIKCLVPLKYVYFHTNGIPRIFFITLNIVAAEIHLGNAD